MVPCTQNGEIRSNESTIYIDGRWRWVPKCNGKWSLARCICAHIFSSPHFTCSSIVFVLFTCRIKMQIVVGFVYVSICAIGRDAFTHRRQVDTHTHTCEILQFIWFHFEFNVYFPSLHFFRPNRRWIHKKTFHVFTIFVRGIWQHHIDWK